MSRIIDGRSLAASIRTRVREEIARTGVTPGLAVVLVGDDPASHLYVRLKEQACAEVGIRFELHRFPDATTTAAVQERLRRYRRAIEKRQERVRGTV